MRYSDIPIRHPWQDLLGRRDFAQTLARAIDNLGSSKDGFVIAILGEWGSGKSSVLELLCHYLRHIEMARVSRRAAPGWREIAPTSVEELDEMFFVFHRVEDQINALEALNLDTTRWQRENRRSSFLRWLGSESDADIADRYWRLKILAEDSNKAIVLRFSPWLIAGRAELATALLSELARTLDHYVGTNVNLAFGDVLKRLSEFAPMAGAGLDIATQGVGGALIRAWGDWSNVVSKRLTTGATLDETRVSLRKTLVELDRKIIVIIDDLDRLTPPEVLEMVSLVKSLGDLPNVIYILSYHDETLANLIRKQIRVDGHRFLEKIVQYPVHLPEVEANDLVGMLNADLAAVVGPLSRRESRRLTDVWLYVLRYYLRTPRDVRRFINAVSVAHAGLRDHTDPIDLLILEALRLFEPEVYKWLRRNISELVS